MLIDEAHNLVDRSRDMHSAALSLTDLEIAGAPRAKGAAKAKKGVATAALAPTTFGKCRADASVIPTRGYHDGAMVLEEPPKEFIVTMRQAGTTAGGIPRGPTARRRSQPLVGTVLCHHCLSSRGGGL